MEYKVISMLLLDTRLPVLHILGGKNEKDYNRITTTICVRV